MFATHSNHDTIGLTGSLFVVRGQLHGLPQFTDSFAVTMMACYDKIREELSYAPLSQQKGLRTVISFVGGHSKLCISLLRSIPFHGSRLQLFRNRQAIPNRATFSCLHHAEKKQRSQPTEEVVITSKAAYEWPPSVEDRLITSDYCKLM